MKAALEFRDPRIVGAVVMFMVVWACEHYVMKGDNHAGKPKISHVSH